MKVSYANREERINKYLGPAYLVEELDYDEIHKSKLSRQLAYVRQQYKYAKDNIAIVRYIDREPKIDRDIYTRFNKDTKEITKNFLTEEIGYINQEYDNDIPIDLFESRKDKAFKNILR